MDDNELIHSRKYLHSHPELSGQEINTSEYIHSQLRYFCPSAKILTYGETGLVATIDGDKKGKHIMLRCELDALPIQETNLFAHKSEIKDVSHKCGHDGHMSILLAVAKYFQEHPIQKGKVSLLFQPAEENGTGAKATINNPLFANNIQPDYVFALHNVPGYPMHSVVVKPGVFTPSVISVKVRLKGKTSHAAEPENGINPAYAIAEILQSTEQKQNTDPDSESFNLITPIYAHLGEETYGTSAGEGEIGFTLRTWSNNIMSELRVWFQNLIREVTDKHKLTFTLAWFEEFNSVENNNDAVSVIEQSANSNKLNLIKKPTPFKWGEDFGLFTENYPGAMFGLGAGIETPALHNPDYDFPDELIETGKNIFVSIIQTIQS